MNTSPSLAFINRSSQGVSLPCFRRRVPDMEVTVDVSIEGIRSLVFCSGKYSRPPVNLKDTEPTVSPLQILHLYLSCQ